MVEEGGGLMKLGSGRYMLKTDPKKDDIVYLVNNLWQDRRRRQDI